MPQIRGADELERWLAERQQLRLHPGEPHVQQLGERWVRVHERRTRDGGLVAIRLDITELVRRDHALSQLNERLAQLNDELSTMSYTDALTGLANRRRFDDKLADETARALRHGLPLALLVVDVDHFKRYNDCHGHPAGDACLQRIAALLRGCAGRGSDVVARIGGEEFALLLPHQTAADGRAVALRVHSRLAAAQIEHGDSPVGPHVTVSIGLADLDGAGRIDAATLLAAADAALYRAKQRGRNRSEIFGDA
jgi:diguanylate cyclase (GGDEF)-like protein